MCMDGTEASQEDTKLSSSLSLTSIVLALSKCLSKLLDINSISYIHLTILLE